MLIFELTTKLESAKRVGLALVIQVFVGRGKFCLIMRVYMRMLTNEIIAILKGYFSFATVGVAHFLYKPMSENLFIHPDKVMLIVRYAYFLMI